jgi:PAS domain S-box-containing protein
MIQRKTHTSLLVAFFAAILTALLFVFLFFIIGVKSRKYTYEDSKLLAREISHKAASETMVYLSSALLTARSLEEKALIYRKVAGDRDDINQMLKDAVNQNSNFMGAWTMWEPNAFDNRDREYRHDTLYDQNGTMSIAFFKFKDSFLFEKNDPQDFFKDFYIKPQLSRKELVLEPYHYQYHGHEYVFYQTSAVVPVFVDSTFVGVFGIDINLDSLQQKLNRIRLYETGFLSLISGKGIIISHIDSSRINRNFFSFLKTSDRKKYASLDEGKELTIETKSEFSGENVFRFFYPVSVGRGARPWYIMVEIPIKKATIRSLQLLNIAYATLILGLLLLTYMIVNIFDRRRYEKDILDSMNRVEESNRIVSESETRYRMIFENANDAIFIMKDAIYLDCNLITFEIFGCRKDQIIGLTAYDFSPAIQPDGSDSTELGNIRIKAALGGEPQRFEWKHRKLDGTLFDAEVSLNRISLQGDLLIMAIIRDISVRKRAEEEIRRNKERLQNFVDSLTDYIYTITFDSNNITQITHGEGSLAITGYTPEELQTDPGKYNEITIAEDLPFIRENIEKLLRGEKIRPFEHRLKHKNGTIKWVRNTVILRYDQQGKVTGFDGLVSDITERRIAEEALQESEKNFRNIFDKTNHGIIIMGPDTRILAANKAFADISGFVLDDHKSLFANDLVIPEQLKILKERISKRLSFINQQPFEYKARYNDGKVHVVEADASIMDYNGQEALLVILRDVTELREAEQRVMEAIIQTEETERSRIAQDLHDGLGPVLSTIKLYFQVYHDTKDDSKKALLDEKLRTIIDEAIKGISDISRNLSPHVLRNYGFYAAIKQFVHHLEQTNLIKFSLNFGNEPNMGNNTSIFLYRAVSELINNSIRHSGCSNIVLKVHQAKGLLWVEYKDDGKGFDVELVLSNPAAGSGIQNIINRIKAFNGDVAIVSSPAKGMITTLKIPLIPTI